MTARRPRSERKPPSDYGPYQRGDFVEEGTFYGIVVWANPRRFAVQWWNTTRNTYRQDYQGIRRARFEYFDDGGESIKATLQAELRPWGER